MPVVESLMKSLTSKYGVVEGENVYYAMEASARGPFAKGRKYHDLHLAFAERHGLPPISEPAKVAPLRGRGRGKVGRAGRTSAGRGRSIVP